MGAGRRRPALLLVHAGLTLAAEAPPTGMVRLPGGSFLMGASEGEPRGRDDLEQQARRRGER